MGTDKSDSVCNAACAFSKRERAFYRAVSRPSAGIICYAETALSTAPTHDFNEMCICEFGIGCVDVRASFNVIKFWDSSCCANLGWYTELWRNSINSTIVAIGYVVKTWYVKPWNGLPGFQANSLFGAPDFFHSSKCAMS